MGQNDVAVSHRSCGYTTLDFQHLKVFSALGRGAKGAVFLVRNDDAFGEGFFALKVISKALLNRKAMNIGGDRERQRISVEQQVLRRFNHPLLPHLRGILESEKTIGYGIDYCPGGSLHSLRKKQPKQTLPIDSIRFYAIELVLVLEYLHNLGIVYRDLKPNNVMIQESGHIMLVDFDLSKQLSPRSRGSLSCSTSQSSHSAKAMPEKKERVKRRFARFFGCYNSVVAPHDSESEPKMESDTHSLRRSESDAAEKCHSFVGTEEYVAPEVVSGRGHDFRVDWWSLGVVLYELLYGTTPFKGENMKQTFYRILFEPPELNGETTPLKDLIRRLLEKDPDHRIEVDEIKGHDFFKGVKWDQVLRVARPPYIPENGVKDKMGIKKVDVELLVHRMFLGKTDEFMKDKRVERKLEKAENGDNDKRGWVEKLNNNAHETENILFF